MKKSDIIDCSKKIEYRIISKKWFGNRENNAYWWGKEINPVYIRPTIREQILINRNCAISIYKKYNTYHWDKLDKYFIEIFQDILEEYDIKKIGFIGDCVDNSFDKGDVIFYVKGDDNKWYNPTECEFGFNIHQTLINKMAKEIDSEIMNKII